MSRGELSHWQSSTHGLTYDIRLCCVRWRPLSLFCVRITDCITVKRNFFVDFSCLILFHSPASIFMFLLAAQTFPCAWLRNVREGEVTSDDFFSPINVRLQHRRTDVLPYRLEEATRGHRVSSAQYLTKTCRCSTSCPQINIKRTEACSLPLRLSRPCKPSVRDVPGVRVIKRPEVHLCT